MSEQQSIPEKPGLSREQEADRALRSTAIGPGWARGLVLAFLALIVSGPLLQFATEMRRVPGRLPRPLRLSSLLPSLGDIKAARTPGALLDLLPKAQSIRNYERDVENGSVLSEWVLPRAQAALSEWGAANEQVYCGVGGWLFYRPDVDYLTARGFLDPEFLRERERASEDGPIHPDPLPAITRFDQQLRARGIALIVMPAPSKPMIQPEKLYAGFPPGREALQNPSYPAFRDALRRRGVRLFDPAEALVEARRRTGRPQFLQTDTHWTPEAMERVADALARYIRVGHLLPASRSVPYRRRAGTAENLGDIALMLKLPPGQRLYAPQQVRIHPVYAPGGEAWRPRRDADVLLLGDSYTAIYSLQGMGWGTGAGLAEQLSASLARPLDRIAINDGGSYTTRQQLLREIARGRDRLRGKRLVIWEFAMRDLTEGDWKPLDLPDARAFTSRAAPGTP